MSLVVKAIDGMSHMRTMVAIAAMGLMLSACSSQSESFPFPAKWNHGTSAYSMSVTLAPDGVAFVTGFPQKLADDCGLGEFESYTGAATWYRKSDGSPVLSYGDVEVYWYPVSRFGPDWENLQIDFCGVESEDSNWVDFYGGPELPREIDS